MYQIDCHCTPWIFDTTKNWHDGLFTLNWIFSTEQAFITIFVYDRVICLYIFFYCNQFSWGLYQKAWPWPYYFSDYVLTLTSFSFWPTLFTILFITTFRVYQSLRLSLSFSLIYQLWYPFWWFVLVKANMHRISFFI